MTNLDFLSSFPNHCLYGLEEQPGSKKPQVVIIEDKEQATIKNSIKYKNGIYFTPNGDYKLSGGKRKKDLATNIYTFILDIDDYGDLGLEEFKEKLSFYLEPSFIIKTGRGRHIYFLLKEPVLYKDYIDQWNEIEESLINIYGGDKNVKDISRILRVPGYKYWKDNTGEKEIYIEYESTIRYGFDEMLELIRHTNESLSLDNNLMLESYKVFKIDKKSRKRNDIESFYESVKNVPVDEVFEDLFKNYEVLPDGSIKDGNQVTRGYKINRQKNYLNSFSFHEERPLGGPFSVAKKYFGTFADVLEYFNDRRNIKFSFENLASFLGKDPDKKLINQNTEKIDGGNGIGLIIRRDTCTTDYYDGDIEGQFTNGIIEPVGYYIKNNSMGQYRLIKLIRKGVEDTIVTLKPFSNSGDLFKQLMKYGIICEHNMRVIKLLMINIMNCHEQYYYTDKLGLQIINGEKVFIYKGGIYIDEKNKIIIDLPEMSNIEIDSPTLGIIDKRKIEEFIITASKFYDLHLVYPLFLMTFLGYNSFFFRDKKMGLPSMFILGISGTGKTEVKRKILEKGFGRSLTLSAGSTAFPYEKIGKHYLPINVEEYRNAALGNKKEQIEGIIRNLFDGTPINKGKATQEINQYEMNCILLICGQTIPDDDAVLTRMLLGFGKEYYKGDYLKYKDLPKVLDSACSLFKDEKDFEKYINLVKESEQTFKKTLDLQRSSDRIIYNYSLLLVLGRLLGLEKYEKYLLDNLKGQDIFLAQDDIKITYQKIFNLQILYDFEVRLHKGGLVIDIIEEVIRTNTADLKGFIRTINEHFMPGDDLLSGTSCYVSFEYIFKNKSLWGYFMKAIRGLNAGNIDISTEELQKTIKTLKAFLLTNYKNHPLISDINGELGLSTTPLYEKEILEDF